MDEDPRQPHISNISPDLAAESDSGGEKIHEVGRQDQPEVSCLDG